MSKNYVALYEGLKAYRDAMLGFVKTQLEAAYRDEWWERGVRRVFRDEDIDRLEKNFERRLMFPRKSESVSRLGQGRDNRREFATQKMPFPPPHTGE